MLSILDDRITRDMLIDYLRKLHERGALLLIVLDNKLAGAVYRKLGRRENVFKVLGIEPPAWHTNRMRQGVTKDELARAFRVWAEEEGNQPIAFEHLRPSAVHCIQTFFRGVSRMSEELGIPFTIFLEGKEDPVPLTRDNDPSYIPDGPEFQMHLKKRRERPRKWSEERVIKEIRDWVASGRTINEIPSFNPKLYSAGRSVFGSFQKAAEAAGFQYKPRTGHAQPRFEYFHHPDRPPHLESFVPINQLPAYLQEWNRVKGAVPISALGRNSQKFLREKYGGLAEAAEKLQITILGKDGKPLVPKEARKKTVRPPAGYARFDHPDRPEHLEPLVPMEQVPEYLKEWNKVRPIPVSALSPGVQKFLREKYGTLAQAARELQITILGKSGQPVVERATTPKLVAVFDHPDRPEHLPRQVPHSEVPRYLQEWNKVRPIPVSALSSGVQKFLRKKYGTLANAAEHLQITILGASGKPMKHRRTAAEESRTDTEA